MAKKSAFPEFSLHPTLTLRAVAASLISLASLVMCKVKCDFLQSRRVDKQAKRTPRASSTAFDDQVALKLPGPILGRRLSRRLRRHLGIHRLPRRWQGPVTLSTNPRWGRFCPRLRPVGRQGLRAAA